MLRLFYKDIHAHVYHMEEKTISILSYVRHLILKSMVYSVDWTAAKLAVKLS